MQFILPAVRSGEEASRKSPQTRLTGPHGHGERTEADIKPDFLRAESEARRGDRAPERLQGCRGFLVCFFTGFSARTEGGSDLRDQLTIAVFY